MEPTSDALTGRLRAGDTSAIGEYLESHRLQLLAFIDRRLSAALRTRIETADIFQELALDALHRIADLQDPNRDAFGWFCQLAEHRLIDAHRSYSELRSGRPIVKSRLMRRVAMRRNRR